MSYGIPQQKLSGQTDGATSCGAQKVSCAGYIPPKSGKNHHCPVSNQSHVCAIQYERRRHRRGIHRPQTKKQRQQAGSRAIGYCTTIVFLTYGRKPGDKRVQKPAQSPADSSFCFTRYLLRFFDSPLLNALPSDGTASSSFR